MAALDRYFHQQASQDQRRKVATPYVFVDTATGALVGYYTLNAYTIVGSSLPVDVTKKLPRYPVYPAILIGRIALDERYQGQRLGRVLLTDALARCLTLSAELGAMAVVVDAKDDGARSFYEHVGFLRLLDEEYRLYIPMATIAALLQASTAPSRITSTPPA